MDGDFELNKIGYYTPKIVEENGWLNDKQKPEDLAKYGKNYAVVFEGEATTYLWTAKNAPEVGKKYWGHLQATSGKSIRFKTDKQEDAPSLGLSPQNSSDRPYVAHNDDKEDSIARAVALKGAVELLAAHGDANSDVLGLAEVFLSWLKNDSGTQGRGEGEVKTSSTPLASQANQNPGSAVGQKRQWDKVGQNEQRIVAGEPLPEPPEDIQELMDFANNDDIEGS